MEKDVIFLDGSSSSIWWNPDIRSKYEKNLALPNWSIISSNLGSGNLSDKFFC